MTTRRHFLTRAVPAVVAAAVLRPAFAATPPRAEENNPTAVALGYKHDASRVDTKKYPKYQPGQNCANCALYQGKPTEPWAPCPALAGKQVAAKGWCSAWVKRA